MLNKVQLIGNLGGDPETRHLSNGTTVVNFNIATSETYKKDGEKKTVTEWHRISLFGSLADIAGKYLKKGSKIYLEGKLKTEEWTDKDGVKRSITKIVGSTFTMLDARKEGTTETVQEITATESDNSDLPF